MGEAAATWGLCHVLSAGGDRQGDRDWLGCSWSCHSSPGFLNKTLVLHSLLELSASQGHQAAGSLPMLVGKVLVVARTAVVMRGKRGPGRGQRPSSSSHCSWLVCFHGEKVFSVATGFTGKQNCSLVKG